MKDKKPNQKKSAQPAALVPKDDFPTDENIFSTWLPTGKIVDEFFVSVRTLYNWRRDEILPFGRLRNKIYYNRSVIEQILSNKWKVITVVAHLLLNGLMNLEIGF